MCRTMPLLLLASFLTACSQETQTQDQTVVTSTVERAETVYMNGVIYTVNEAQPWVDAVAIKDGKFLVVGTNSDVRAVTGEDTEVVDLGGQFAMPGLIDTHTHPFVDGYKQLGGLSLDLETAPASLEEIQRQVSEYADANPDREWIFGGMWPKGLFPGENAHRSWLDAAVPDRPTCLMDQGGHSYWCNTFALETAGMMDPDFEPPAFSIVERDEDGLPSGTIRETALGHMKGFMPRPTMDMSLQAIELVQNLFNAQGITAHRTATGNELGLQALQQVAANGDLTLHWAVGMDVNYLESTYSFEERMAQIARRKQYESEFVKTDYAKIFIDGDVNGFGIRLLEPFEGTTDEYGNLAIDPDDAARWLTDFDQQGISVQFHAIGDGSIQVVIDSLQAAVDANGGALQTRHYPDHNGLPTEAQIVRLVELNGIIGFAPSFGFTFPGVHESYLQFLGPDRLKRLQPLRSALDAGAIIATGTDWASLPQDPWPLIEGMTHRRNPWVAEGESESNNAAEAITVEEAIRAYTLGGAHAILREDDIGSIEVGKYADFIVLDRNLTRIDNDDIDQTRVLMTVFSGRVVFEKNTR